MNKHVNQMSTSQLRSKYNPPEELSKPETVIAPVDREEYECQRKIVVAPRTESGSVLKFTNEEQMLAYNDIEQLNQLTQKHVAKSR